MKDKEPTDWDKWKARCSSIGKIMANSRDNPPITEIQKKKMAELMDRVHLGNITPKQKEELAVLVAKEENSKNVVLSDSCIGYLVEAYAWETEGMFSVTKDLDIEYIQKGRLGEEEGIKLLSIVDGQEYKKNTERVCNDFLTGEPDVFSGEKVMQSEIIQDTKLSWDYPGFLYKMQKPVDPLNDFQLKGYTDITGATSSFVSHVLITTPESIRNSYKHRLFYQMDCVTEESPQFVAAWTKLERAMIFDHIPVHKRVYKMPVEIFTETQQQAVYERVRLCRGWLAQFHERMLQLNLT